ncbi:MAG: hypothetical protein WCU00_02650 [Candidatus Latescibacterota bacterium]|jgi:hypothetical protein
MKTTKLITVLTFALFVAFASNAFTASPTQGTNSNSASFVDENGDGVCDNYSVNGGKGLGLGKGEKRNYVDSDGDGICDNTGSGTKNKMALKNKNYNKAAFVDADGDGVCDNAGTGKNLRNSKGNEKSINSVKK